MTTEQAIQMHKDHSGQGYYTTCGSCSKAQADANRPAKSLASPIVQGRPLVRLVDGVTTPCRRCRSYCFGDCYND